MIKLGVLLGTAAILALSGQPGAAKGFPSDVFSTSGGDLKITFIGHGTLMMEYQGKVIQIDPWTKLADYSTLPRADLVLLTHEHRDHLDPQGPGADHDRQNRAGHERLLRRSGQGQDNGQRR